MCVGVGSVWMGSRVGSRRVDVECMPWVVELPISVCVHRDGVSFSGMGEE